MTLPTHYGYKALLTVFVCLIGHGRPTDSVSMFEYPSKRPKLTARVDEAYDQIDD